MHEPMIDWNTFVEAVAHDDGRAAREHLDAGRPVYYRERSTPAGLLIERHPDGRRELVRWTPTGPIAYEPPGKD